MLGESVQLGEVGDGGVSRRGEQGSSGGGGGGGGGATAAATATTRGWGCGLGVVLIHAQVDRQTYIGEKTEHSNM